MKVQSYLMFPGTCEAAVEFYTKALGARVNRMVRYDEMPDPAPPGMVPPGSDKKIMHVSFSIGDTELMASDDCGGGKPFGGFNLSISVHTAAEADKVFNALAEGGKVFMPLTQTFWSPRFGMLTDKFGVSWMVNLEST